MCTHMYACMYTHTHIYIVKKHLTKLRQTLRVKIISNSSEFEHLCRFYLWRFSHSKCNLQISVKWFKIQIVTAQTNKIYLKKGYARHHTIVTNMWQNVQRTSNFLFIQGILNGPLATFPDNLEVSELTEINIWHYKPFETKKKNIDFCRTL